MAYTTSTELAAVLNIEVTPENRPVLEACLNAAATEIDHHVAAQLGFVELDPGLLHRTNINRAVEWFKSPDAFNGGVGYNEVGTIPATLSGFERHAEVLLPYKTSWGLA